MFVDKAYKIENFFFHCILSWRESIFLCWGRSKITSREKTTISTPMENISCVWTVTNSSDSPLPP